MTDRTPTQPGRMLITPEDGSAAYYATVAQADNPYELGTPWSKAAVLTDDTATALGLDPANDPTPNDAIMALSANKANTELPQETNIILASGMSIYGGRKCSYWKNQFNEVTVVVAISSGTAIQTGVNTTIGALPIGYRPNQNVVSAATLQAPGGVFYPGTMQVGPDGNIVVAPPASHTGVTIMFANFSFVAV